jgi:hypothetical protein
MRAPKAILQRVGDRPREAFARARVMQQQFVPAVDDDARLQQNRRHPRRLQDDESSK